MTNDEEWERGLAAMKERDGRSAREIIQDIEARVRQRRRSIYRGTKRARMEWWRCGRLQREHRRHWAR